MGKVERVVIVAAAAGAGLLAVKVGKITDTDPSAISLCSSA
jgi:hypothetical protein